MRQELIQWIPAIPPAGNAVGLNNFNSVGAGFSYVGNWIPVRRQDLISVSLSTLGFQSAFEYTLTLQGSNDFWPEVLTTSMSGNTTIVSSTSTSVGVGFLADTAQDSTWLTNQFTGFQLRDSAGNWFPIVFSTEATFTLTLSPSTNWQQLAGLTAPVLTPAAGAYTIQQIGQQPSNFTAFTLVNFTATQAATTDPLQQQPLTASITEVGTTTLTAQFPACAFVRPILTYVGSGAQATGSFAFGNAATPAVNDIATTGTGSLNAWTDTTGLAAATGTITVTNDDVTTTSGAVGTLNTYTDAGTTFSSADTGRTLIDSAGSLFTVTYVSAHVLSVTGTPASGAGTLSAIHAGDIVAIGGHSLIASLTTTGSGTFKIGVYTTVATNIGTAIGDTTVIAALVSASVTSNAIALTAQTEGSAGNSITLAVTLGVAGSVTLSGATLASGAQGPFAAAQVGWTLIDHAAAPFAITAVNTNGSVLTVVGTPSGSAQSGTVTATQIGDTVTIGGITLTAGTTTSATHFKIGSYTGTATALASAIADNTSISVLVTASAASGVVTLTAVNGGAPGNNIPLSAVSANSDVTITPMSGGASEGAISGTLFAQGPQ